MNADATARPEGNRAGPRHEELSGSMMGAFGITPSPAVGLNIPFPITYLQVMNLDLTDKETAALTRLLSQTIDANRYPLSPRIQTGLEPERCGSPFLFDRVKKLARAAPTAAHSPVR